MTMRTTPKPCRDILKVLPDLAKRRVTAVRLHPRRGKVAELGASKLGGSFLWPKDEPWPTCSLHQLSYVGILQLTKKDVPELGFKPGTDVFQLLWCPQDHSEPLFIVAPKVFWRRAGDVRTALRTMSKPELDNKWDADTAWLKIRISSLEEWPRNPELLLNMMKDPGCARVFFQHTLKKRPFPVRTKKDLGKLLKIMKEELVIAQAHVRVPTSARSNYVPKPCCLHPERVVEFADIEELPQKSVRKLQAWDIVTEEDMVQRVEDFGDGEDGFTQSLYVRELSVCDGTKVGGYVAWVQRSEVPVCKCKKSMEHLLTIASAECDGANWRRWLAKEDQPCWGKEKANRIVAAPGLMLGDVGKLFFFVCRKCPDWPVQSVFQCS